MIDDAMLVGRADRARSATSGATPSGRCSRRRRAVAVIDRRRRPVPARAARRRPRRRRAPGRQPALGVARHRAARIGPPSRGSSSPTSCRRRSRRRSTGRGRRLRHRGRQLGVAHGDPRALARRAGGRRRARATTASRPGSVILDGTTGECPRSTAMRRARRLAAPQPHARRSPRARPPRRPAGHARRRRHPARRQPRAGRRARRRAGARRRRHRPVPLGVPADADGRAPTEPADGDLPRILARTPGEVTIRTFDADGRAARPARACSGPARAAGRSGQHAQFKKQIRALLRAAASAGRLRILLPFVTDVDDFRAARAGIARTRAAAAARRRGADACRSGRWSKCRRRR